jgi:hypothetical protein
LARRRTPRALRLLIGGSALASAVIAWAPMAFGLPAANGQFLGCSPFFLPVIALVLGLAALLDVSLPLGRLHWQVRGLDAAGAALLYLCPGPGLWIGTLLASAGLVVAARMVRGRRWRSMEYAVSSALLQAAVASTLTCGLRYAGVPPIAAAVAGILAAAFTRHAMAASGVALTARRSLFALLLPRLPAALLTAIGNGAVGLLDGWLLVHAPLGLAGLIVPGLLVVSTYELQSRRSAEARLFAALATEQQHAAGRSLEQSVAVLMTVAARVLGGADVELLLSGPEGLVRYTGDESGVNGRMRTDPSAFDAPWVRQLLAGGAVRIAPEDGQPSCAFSVGNGRTPRAVIAARRPAGGSAFTRRDAVFARALARQAASWLSPSLEPTAARDPRLEVVREIARRILRSPEPTADPQWSSSLLDEVHGLERAVAALLGSAPGGTIPPQRDRRTAPEAGEEPGAPVEVIADDLHTESRREPEWTTTGRLPRPGSPL